MAISERQRLHLADAVTESLGQEAAATLMELLVPAGDHPATRRDLSVHADRVDDRMTSFETRVDERMTAFERHVDARIDHLRDELTAVFREELVVAVSGQTHAVIVSSATAMFGIGGLAVTLAQLLG